MHRRTKVCDNSQTNVVNARYLPGERRSHMSEVASPASQPVESFLENWLPYIFGIVGNKASATLHEIYSVRFGLTNTGFKIAIALESRTAVSAKELGRLTALDQVAITRGVDRLKEQGLVLRTRDEVDKRCVVLQLSSHGKMVLAEMKPIMQEIEAELHRCIPQGRMRELRAMAQVLAAHATEKFSEGSAWRRELVGRETQAGRYPFFVTEDGADGRNA